MRFVVHSIILGFFNILMRFCSLGVCTGMTDSLLVSFSGGFLLGRIEYGQRCFYMAIETIHKHLVECHEDIVPYVPPEVLPTLGEPTPIESTVPGFKVGHLFGITTPRDDVIYFLNVLRLVFCRVEVGKHT